MAKSHELSVKQTESLALVDYGEDAPKGPCPIRNEDCALPWVILLQSGSKPVKTVEGAKEGLVLNTATKQLASSFQFIPASEPKTRYVEWIPRTKGGGFVASHDRDSDLVRKTLASGQRFGKIPLENGNELEETVYAVGMVDFGDGLLQQACIPFKSTKMRQAKDLAYRLKLHYGAPYNAPFHANLFNVTTVLERNKRGEEYYVYSIAHNGFLARDDARFQAAKSLAVSMNAGSVKLDESSLEAEPTEEAF